MKYVKWAPLVFVLMALLGIEACLGEARAEGVQTITSCTLADGTRAELKAESHGSDGVALYVDEGGKTQPAFLDMPNNQFIGNVKLARCVGGALVFALDYGPPYIKGVVIRRNPQSHADERIYFAEKALPRWLYLNDREMLLVVPNLGHETGKKYLVYEFIAGKGQIGESRVTDTLPAPTHNMLSLRPR
jgi:hypothetical protein